MTPDKQAAVDVSLSTPSSVPKPSFRVWWIPQVPMETFHFQVSTVAEGALILDALARYDQFQLDHNIKGEYANVGGLQLWEEDSQEWVEWADPVTDEGIDEYMSQER